MIRYSIPLLCFSAFANVFASVHNEQALRFDNKDTGNYLKVEFLREDLVRFESAKVNTPHAKQFIWESPMIQKQEWEYPLVHSNGTDYETNSLRVRVNKDLCVHVEDKVANKHLAKFCTKNLDQYWKQLQMHSTIDKNVYGLGQYFQNPGSTEADWLGKIWDPLYNTMGNALRPFSGGSTGYTMFPIAYVLGEAHENYAVFLDNTYKQMWSFVEDPWTVQMFGDQIRWYVIRGDSLKDLRKKYMELVGRPPMPPVETFGLWVSRFGFENWNQVSDELHGLRQHHFPVEGFVLDLQWFGGNFFRPGDDLRPSKMGTLSFDPLHFSNAEQTIQSFAEREGIHFMPIEESYVSVFLPEHREMESRGYLARDCHRNQASMIDHNPWWGKGGMIDWTHPSAGEFWHESKRKKIIDYGIRFHWTDLGEPEMYREDSCYYGFPELGKQRHADIHNIFNLKWSESIYKGYKRHHPRERFFILSRSGTSGLQRYGSGMWSGDVGANMGSLTAHLAVQTHMSLSGVDYYGSDVGGFHRNASTLDGDENELYTQWFANSCLFDFPIRPHVWTVGQNKQTSPARIGHLESNLANLKLRYELFPYYYSLAWKAHSEGSGMVNPMVYEFQDNNFLRKIGHQKMIGPYLMAAVVARYGETERDVYLPKGKWVSWHTGEFFNGGDNYVHNIPTHYNGKFQLPLFLKGGAIVPILKLEDNTRNIKEALHAHNRPLALKVVPDWKPSSFVIYEDDYESTDYQSGKFALTHIHQYVDDEGAHIYFDKKTSRPMLLKVLTEEAVQSVNAEGRALAKCAPGIHQNCWEQSSRNEISVYVDAVVNVDIK